MAERLMQPDRLQQLSANLLDDAPAATRERRSPLTVFRGGTPVDGAMQTMFDFIEQGVVSPRDADFTASPPSAAGAPISNRRYCWPNASHPLPTGASRRKRWGAVAT